MLRLLGRVEMQEALAQNPLGSNWELGGIAQLQRSTLKSEGSEPHPGLPSLSTNAWKGSPQNIWLWKSVGIPPTGAKLEAAGNPGVLFKSHCTKSSSQEFTLGSIRTAAQQGLELHRKRLCNFRKRAGRAETYVPVLSSFPTLTTDTIFPGWSPSLCTTLAWLPESPPCQACTLQRNLLAAASLGLGCTLSCKVLEEIWENSGCIWVTQGETEIVWL